MVFMSVAKCKGTEGTGAIFAMHKCNRPLLELLLFESIHSVWADNDSLNSSLEQILLAGRGILFKLANS